MPRRDAVDAGLVQVPDRNGVLHSFANGVRGQESVWLDLQFGGVECPASEDMARQEYKESADLEYQVRRFGVGVHQPNYGSVDTDLDLTRAMELVEESRGRWLALPVAIRQRYSNWREVEQAAQSGELEQVLKAAGLLPGGSGSDPAASPSDSAAGGAPKAS